MNVLSKWWFLVASAAALLGQSASPQDRAVMLAAVSRDESLLRGGMGLGKMAAKGTVVVEPLARLAPSGDWQTLPCNGDYPNGCAKFEEEYLSKPHLYTVVSADGLGGTISAVPTTLDECFGFTGTGTYSGADIEMSAIAASSTDFLSSAPPHLLPLADATPVVKAFASATSARLDSTKHLQTFSVRLEGQDLVVVQRSYVDYNGEERLKLIFAIGAVDRGGFQILHWKENIDDEDEIVLGTIRLKNGHDFLITTVRDPESQSFRVYGIKGGKLQMVYSGGGSSC